MAILSDLEISQLCTTQKPILFPFEPALVRKLDNIGSVISYGCSSYGYDIRCSNEFKVFKCLDHTFHGVIDPKNFNEASVTDVISDICIIPPSSVALARSVEYFRMPRDLLGVCFGKSTYARCGIIVNVTPLEPGWEGYLTIELSNTTPLPVKIYANEGIAQIMFLKGDVPPKVSYKDRAGKYQNQVGITLPKC